MKTKIVAIAFIICLIPFAVCHAQNEREKGLEKLRNGPKELCEAIEKGNLKAVKTIIKKGIDVNLPVKKDEFPLFYAAGCGRPEITRLLIKAGANINIMDSYGDTALHIAIREGNYEVAEILISSGADINAKIQKGFYPGFRPLHTAVNGKKDIPHLVSLLISKGAEINSRDAKGKTPLEYATMNRFHQSEQILLKHEKAPENFQKNTHFPAPKGPYIGQNPPGMTAEIFAPDIVSTEHGEFCSVFSHDGTKFYWSIAGAPYPVIAAMSQNEGRWAEPEIVPFSGKYLDLDMAFAPDGERLFFCSRRPLEGNGPPTGHTDFWFVERDGAGWSEPRHLPGPVNSDGQEYYPVFAQNGTLYFCSTRAGGHGGGDIYRALYADGTYLEPENLGPPINTANFEGDLYIAADESYIIVTCYDRPDSFGSGDLYINFRQEDGSWSPMKNMGVSINTAANEHCPMLSPDGKYLFFSSGRSRHQDYSKTAITYSEKIAMMNSWGNGRNEDIYWVDARIIETLRPKDLNPNSPY